MLDKRSTCAAGFRRVAALVCTAAYLVSGTEAFPQLLALGAWLEGSHTVWVGRSLDQITAVLSHERGVPGRPGYNPQHQAGNRLHRHNTAARFFCLFAGRTGRNADHVASFTTGSVFVSPAGANKTKLQSPFPAVLAAPTVLTDLASAPVPLSMAQTGLAAARSAALLQLLRSTLLVI